MSDASERIKQTTLTAGRGMYAVNRTKQIAQTHSLPTIEARCGLAYNAYDAQDKAEQAWAITQSQSTLRADALNLDRTIDGMVHTSIDVCEAQLKLARIGVQNDHTRAAALLTRRCFPRGARPITHVSYEDQLPRLREIAAAFAEPDVAQAATLLGVAPSLQFIADNLDNYELFIQRLGVHITWREVAARRDHAHDELCELIALILAQTPGDALAPTRAALLAPIDEQTAILREQRKTRRATTDLDPITGDERPISPIAEDPNP